MLSSLIRFWFLLKKMKKENWWNNQYRDIHILTQKGGWKRDWLPKISRTEGLNFVYYWPIKSRVGINFCKINVKLSLNCRSADLKHPGSWIVTLFDLGNPWNRLQEVSGISLSWIPYLDSTDQVLCFENLQYLGKILAGLYVFNHKPKFQDFLWWK